MISLFGLEKSTSSIRVYKFPAVEDSVVPVRTTGAYFMSGVPVTGFDGTSANSWHMPKEDGALENLNPIEFISFKTFLYSDAVFKNDSLAW